MAPKNKPKFVIDDSELLSIKPSSPASNSKPQSTAKNTKPKPTKK